MMDKKYCLNCGSLLGVDCGDAEPDYSEHYCSKGCYKEDEKEIPQVEIPLDLATFIKNNPGANFNDYLEEKIVQRFIKENEKESGE